MKGSEKLFLLKIPVSSGDSDPSSRGKRLAVGGSFFRQFPSIFVGCSMADRNVRRILYHLWRERISSSKTKKHYAILPRFTEVKDDFDDAVLNFFSIILIRIDGVKKIGEEVEAIFARA